MWDENATQANHPVSCVSVIKEFEEKVSCIFEEVVGWGFFGGIFWEGGVSWLVGFFNSVNDRVGKSSFSSC